MYLQIRNDQRYNTTVQKMIQEHWRIKGKHWKGNIEERRVENYG